VHHCRVIVVISGNAGLNHALARHDGKIQLVADLPRQFADEYALRTSVTAKFSRLQKPATS
jgi:hypothetical protein